MNINYSYTTRTCYNPLPPRVWSRVQNPCSYVTGIGSPNPGYIKVPYSGKIIPFADLGKELAMIRKGNVLQYKMNSSNLTHSQKYSKIAKGQWTNRSRTWATQNANGFSNPNTQSLLRVGGIKGNTVIDAICSGPIIHIDNNLPPIISPVDNQGDELPPIINPSDPGDNNLPPVPIIPQPILPLFPDFGNLVCNTKHNPCNGETIFNKANEKCNPTSDSDVPGPIRLLCWNDGFPTWYPRQRYIMNNSTNGWPKNYKPTTAAIQAIPPEITYIDYTNPLVNISWKEKTCCLDISYYSILVNEKEVVRALGTQIHTNWEFVPTLPPNSTYLVTMRAVIQYEQGLIVSEPSNTVKIKI